MAAENFSSSEQTSWESGGGRTYYRDRARITPATPGAIVIRKSDVEIRTLADWRLYAPPRGGDSQWRDYRSAKELARAWCPDGIGPTVPPETRALLHTRPEFSGFEIVEAVPEYRVRFDDFPGDPRNADLMVTGVANGEEFIMNVEGRGDEPFGAYISDELMAAARHISRESPAPSFGRITELADCLLPPRLGGEAHLGELRYQLLTSIAGTLACATENRVRRAVLLIHEFRTHITNDAFLSDNHRDLERMIERLTNGNVRSVGLNQLIGPLRFSGNSYIDRDVELFVGKVRRELLAMEF